MSSTTGGPSRGETRGNWALAFTPMSSRSRLHGRRGLGGGATPVPLEGAGGGELAEPVADHVLGDEDRHVATAVVDRDGVAHHDRQDHPRARPGLHDLLLVARV